MKQPWKERTLNYIDFMYKEKAEAWKDKHDDRKLFSNTYYTIRDAILSLEDEPHNFVCVAMNRSIKEDYETMNRILKHFENR